MVFKQKFNKYTISYSNYRRIEVWFGKRFSKSNVLGNDKLTSETNNAKLYLVYLTRNNKDDTIVGFT